MSVVVVFSVSGDDGDGGNTQGEMMMSLMRLVLGRVSECMYVCMYVYVYACVCVCMSFEEARMWWRWRRRCNFRCRVYICHNGSYERGLPTRSASSCGV